MNAPSIIDRQEKQLALSIHLECIFSGMSINGWGMEDGFDKSHARSYTFAGTQINKEPARKPEAKGGSDEKKSGPVDRP
jgi:hypothetical protein